MPSLYDSIKKVHTSAWLALGTMVRIQIISGKPENVIERATNQAVAAIHSVEAACSRFDSKSELVHLVNQPAGNPVQVSSILFRTLQFAWEVAKLTEGRFDPTVALSMEQLGFRRHYLNGEICAPSQTAVSDATFRDIELDEENRIVSLHRPLHLDLGAVAKGFAVDLAVSEFSNWEFDGFVIDAGGDVYVGGTGADGQLWSVGIRHPEERQATIRTLKVSNVAICTSGTYERRSPVDSGIHHILDARNKTSTRGITSITVAGPFAMLADAFSTAAFTYPCKEALCLLEGVGLEGMIVTDDLDIQQTSGMEEYLNE